MTRPHDADRPSTVDGPPKAATAARIYDYFIGGTHNFPADRAAAQEAIRRAPTIPAISRANRAFLRRAVRFAAERGIRQFLDIGSGIPTEGNVHEIAQSIAADSRVVYVDIDPVAVAESLAILEGNDRATAIRGDLRDAAAVLSAPEVAALDFNRPVAVLLCAVLHFMPDDDEVRTAIAALSAACCPGSYLIISHGAPEDLTDADEDAVQTVYTRTTTTPFRLRPPSAVAALFDGYDLVEPGLVWTPQWHPAADDPTEFRADPRQSFITCGVGTKR